MGRRLLIRVLTVVIKHRSGRSVSPRVCGHDLAANATANATAKAIPLLLCSLLLFLEAVTALLLFLASLALDLRDIQLLYMGLTGDCRFIAKASVQTS
jgi:hypothetical protein